MASKTSAETFMASLWAHIWDHFVDHEVDFAAATRDVYRELPVEDVEPEMCGF